jgi:hypothetical protein
MSKIKTSKFWRYKWVSFTVMSENIILLYEKTISMSKRSFDWNVYWYLRETKVMVSAEGCQLWKNYRIHMVSTSPLWIDDIIAEITKKMTYPSRRTSRTASLAQHLLIITNLKVFNNGRRASWKLLYPEAADLFWCRSRKNDLVVSEGVKDNSFLAEQGALPGDVIKEISSNCFIDGK